MTRYGFHTESRMRETCTYGSMRGRAYPTGASRSTLHPSVYVLLYMLDCATAVACVVMGLEATEDRNAAVREGGDKNAEGMATLPL